MSVPTLTQADIDELLEGLTDAEVADLVATLPPSIVEALIKSTPPNPVEVPVSPFAQAHEIDEGYRERAHLKYLSDRLAVAVTDVERGVSRRVQVSMPPRSGKSLLSSVYLPLWLLRKHPDWKIGMISHDPTLATAWGRSVRREIEQRPSLGISLARDAGAVSEWQTTIGGGITSRSAPGQSVTGRGFKVMILDDLVKDFASAHSQVARQALWDWWLANAQSRLEPPSLIIVIGTRWHEDDFIGRLLSSEWEGEPDDWESIQFPAIATTADVIGRETGEPLLSPLVDETDDEARDRWSTLKRSIGTYAWSALYQQSPSPSKGAIFNSDWWRYWTLDPAKASRTPDGDFDPLGKVVYVDPEQMHGARWLDSWDCTFKDKRASDFVVGQRWMAQGPNRYLIAQSRARRSFTSTVSEMRRWVDPHGVVPYSRLVHERLIEDKANGTAVIDTLKAAVSGLIPINPTESKQARAYAVTPDCEAGNVLLPLPSDRGNEWVPDFLDELQNFPNASHDDQVDAFTQALNRMRAERPGSLFVPSHSGQRIDRLTRGQAALQQQSDRRYSVRR